MSSVHCVVVWEWQSGGQWLPHTPGVARTLERAHAKKLTRVVLADADPALKGYFVNLRTLTQSVDTPDGGSVECMVRRACYSVQSPAGRGARWEWARFVAPPMGGELNYEPLPMEIQCAVEEAWAAGGESVTFEGWVVSVSRMTARCGAAVRLVRRAPHPPYPLARSPAPHPSPPPPPPPPPPPERAPIDRRRARIPHQHTGASVQSAPPAAPAAPAPAARPAGARSASPRERKPGLARQILHNLNIFSSSSKPPAGHKPPHEAPRADADAEAEAEAGSRSPPGRRHSVDTVSTYLSHESKESLQQAAVGELLNCSGGSDDVFELPPLAAAPAPAPAAAPTSDGTIVGVDEASAQVCVWVRAVECPQWGALCPACLRALDAPGGGGGGGGGEPAVALTGCHHLMHLHCLNEHLERLRANQEPLYIECLVCGRVYGGEGGGGGGAGPQPGGSMAWSLQPAALPQHPPGSTSILVTYNFQSGRQGARHPAPGAPYYAVGFPRHSLLPDTPLGRQVLAALRAAWERRVLFTLRASRTTGREHVVAWRAPPAPPAAPHQYARPAHPARLLAAALHALHALLQAADTLDPPDPLHAL